MHTSARFARPERDGSVPIAVTRQPILDREENVVAFELLSPAGDESPANVVAHAIGDIGLPRLVGDRRAHVAVTREFLLALRPLPLDPQRVVLGIEATQHADDLLLMTLREARAAGFRVVLDGFSTDAIAFFDHADMVKLDIGAQGWEALESSVELARVRGLEPIASGVGTRAAYSVCRRLGFTEFQGPYFAEPSVVSGATVPTYRLRALSMLAAGDATSFEQLERVIMEDPGLSLKLVKLANSAYFAGRHRVATIRQALTALGSVTVRRWAALLVLAGETDRPGDLLELGLLRARLCELVASRMPGAEPDRAFTAGLFSIVGALLGLRLPALLAELPFDERTLRALGEHAGVEGRILAGVLAYEAGDFEGCARAGVGLVDIARAYGEALDWTDGTLVALSA
jgi:c-di-GMP phosphodiesterase